MIGETVPLFHIWFSTKHRKWLLEGDVGDMAEQALKDVAVSDGIRLLECTCLIDHVHLLVDAESPKVLPAVMKALKGKSAHRVFQQAPELKLDAMTNHLWQRGYAWKIVPAGAEATVRRYIRTQLDRLEKYQR